jgi:predicted ATPase/class 3 adenylate cyclase
MSDPPTGTVTFFFTDIEGSTHLLQHLGDVRYAQVLADQRRIMRAAFAHWRGHEFHTEGDAFLVAFPTAADAVAAAAAALRALAAHPWPDGAPVRVRVGLHTGEAILVGEGYVGLDVHRTNRVMSAGYGGQVLLSQATREHLDGNLPEGLSLRDLGEHRLKDLTTPEHLYQLVIPGLPGTFPPPKTLDAVSNNLPIQQTSFIGRERETEEVKHLLRSSRLVTLMGPGGAGKTRLAIQVAADLIEDFKHGAWLVELEPLRDPNLVVQTIATTLGVREVAGRALLESLIDYLQPKSLLLVVDNCEHLVESCAGTLGALLRVCPTLRVLATSRDALGVAGEATFQIPPLARPDARRRYSVDELAQFAAVRLFVERAVQSDSAFALNDSNASPVARITQRLDGIPLAIELAAAQVSTLSAADIDTRLNDRFLLLTGGRSALPHHQTLRATIDWSYDLLGAGERPLFRRLSVFSGGFALDAVEAICGWDEVDVVDLLDVLTHLVDKSLVHTEARDGDVRYRMLETVRQYGQEKLVEAEEAESLRRRHMAWFLELAEQHEPELRGPEQIQALEALEVEVDNLRAALQWGGSAGEARADGMRLAAALGRFWEMRGYLSEGLEWLEGFLRVGGGPPSDSRARALYGAAVLALRQGDYTKSEALSSESLRIFRSRGEARGTALSLNLLGLLARNRADIGKAQQYLDESLEISRAAGLPWPRAEALSIMGLTMRRAGNMDGAQTCATESLELWRETGDKRGLAASVSHLGTVARYFADYERARALHEESLALQREIGDKLEITASLISLGAVALEQGDNDRATELFGESLALSEEMGNKFGAAASLGNLAIVARHQGNHEQARQLLERSKDLWHQLDDKHSMAITTRIQAMVATAQGNHAQAVSLFQESLALSQPLGDRLGIAESMEGLAAVAIAEGQAERAVRLLGAAEALREAAHTPIRPADLAEHRGIVAAAQAAVREQTFQRLWAEGRAMSLEQAVASASAVDLAHPAIPDSIDVPAGSADAIMR